MVLPINLLLDHDVNTYALTCAMIKRAKQILATGEAEPEKEKTDNKANKIVTSAITQILKKKVKYRYN